MGGDHFYHGAIRKYIIMFGSMFNDIDIVRRDKNGAAVQQIRVPIANGPFLVRTFGTPGGKDPPTHPGPLRFAQNARSTWGAKNSF